MSLSFAPERYKGVASGDFAPFSTAAKHADENNPWAMNCWGARISRKHVIAGKSGGLAAPPVQEGP